MIYRLDDADDIRSLRIVHISATAAHLLGVENTQELTGQLIRDVNPEESFEGPYPEILKTARTGEPCDLGKIPIELDGATKVFTAQSFGLPDGCVGVSFEEVTEQLALEESLKEQALRFRAIFDATFQLIGLLKPDGTLLEANRTALDFGGLVPEDVIGKPFWECYWWSYAEPVQKQLKAAVLRAASGEFVRYTVQVRGDGDTRATIDFSLKPVYDGDRVVLLIPEGRVITELVKAQRALKQVQKRTERILNSAGEGIVGIDHQGKVSFVNDAAASLLGPRPEELVGRPHGEVLKHIDAGSEEPVSLAIEHVLDRERMRRVVSARFERSNGEVFPVEYIVTPLRERGRTGAVVVFRDISERLEAERALRESELRHRTVVEALREGVVLQDAEGRIIAANPAAERILGLTFDQLRGRTSLDPRWGVIDEDGEPLPGEQHPAMVSLRTGEPVEGFVQGVTLPDGDIRWILVNASPIRDHGDDPVSVVSTFTDITDYRQAQEQVRESEVRHRTVLLTLDEGVVLIDHEGRVLAHNPAVEEILDMKVEEGQILRQPADRTIVDQLGRPVSPRELPERLALRSGRPQRGVVLGLVGASGATSWINVNAQPIMRPGADGTRAVVMSIADITEQVEAERELRTSEAELQSAQQIARIGSWRYDPIADDVHWSEQMHRIYGTDPVHFEATFHAFLSIIHPEDRDRTAAVIGEALNNQASYEVTHRVVPANGEAVRFVHGRGEALTNASGEVVLLQGTCQDITDQQAAREALQRYARELEERNTELEQFAYVASHDLQEPLRMVSSFLQLLQRRYGDQLDPTADEYISFAVDGAKRMQRLIQDLLAYSRVGTRGKAFQRVRMGEIVQEVMTDLKPALDEAAGEVETPDDLPTVSADPTQMRQLLQNLIGNAIKFRGDVPPRIRLHVRRTTDEGQQVWQFSVEDNGIGIAPEHVERIFQIFQRLHTRDEYAGTGIGLAICRKIVERHGGRIWLDSEPGRGSTFHFTIPASNDRQPGVLPPS